MSPISTGTPLSQCQAMWMNFNMLYTKPWLVNFRRYHGRVVTAQDALEEEANQLHCPPPNPSKGCKAAGRLDLLFDPTAGNLGFRALDHDLANFATQDGVRDPVVITRLDCNFACEPLLGRLHLIMRAQL